MSKQIEVGDLVKIEEEHLINKNEEPIFLVKDEIWEDGETTFVLECLTHDGHHEFVDPFELEHCFFKV